MRPLPIRVLVCFGCKGNQMAQYTTKPDGHGRHWVYVSAGDAHAHRLGQPGVILWAVAAWLMLNAGLAIISIMGGSLSGLLWGAVFAGAAMGLIFRKYWGWWLCLLGCIRVLWIFAILGGAKAIGPGGLIFLGNAVIAVGVGFYLIEGARPNLIYRHRYRSYRAEGIGGSE